MANKELEKTSMTLYEKIEQQGIEKGIEKVEIIGKNVMLKEFIGEKKHVRKDLKTMTLVQLKKLFKSL